MAHNNKNRTWLDKRCDDYKENYKKWRYQFAHYDGDELVDQIMKKSKRFQSKLKTALDSTTTEYVIEEIKESGELDVSEVLQQKSITFGDGGGWTTYLPRRPGEKAENYVDRLKTSDYTNHMARVINAYVGMMSAVSDRTKRTWQDDEEARGLRDHPSRGNVASRLEQDADGKGTAWAEKIQDLLIKMLVFDKAYVLVEGLPEEGDSEAKLKFIDPRKVVNKKYEDGKLVELLVKDTRVVEPSIKSERKEQTEYIFYHREGWERYRKEDGEVLQVVDDDGNPVEGEYEFYEGATKDERTIPVVEMEIDMNIGSTLATKANRIFQKQSERDHKQRMMSAQLLTLDMEDRGFEEARRTLTRGGRTLQGGGEFINPSSEPVSSYNQTIKEKENDLYKTFFLDNQDAPSEKTATALRQNFRSGLEAILNVLKNELDRTEQRLLTLIEQVYFADSPQLWGQATVKRPSDFEPKNKEAQAQKLRKIFFDMPKIKLPAETRAKILSRILDLMNIDSDEDALLSEAREQEVTEAQQNQSAGEAPIEIES